MPSDITAFEKWFRENCKDLELSDPLLIGGKYIYENSSIQNIWKGWQGRERVYEVWKEAELIGGRTVGDDFPYAAVYVGVVSFVCAFVIGISLGAVGSSNLRHTIMQDAVDHGVAEEVRTIGGDIGYRWVSRK